MLRSGMVHAGILSVFVVCGCASMPDEAEDDTNAIMSAADTWSAALIAHDLDALMQLFSEDFSDADGNTKTSIRDFLAGSIVQGVLDDLEVAREYVVLTIDGDAATYKGILLTSALGSVTVDLTLAREEDGWKIVSMLAS